MKNSDFFLKPSFSLLLLFFFLQVYSQNNAGNPEKYTLVENISYRTPEEAVNDTYMAERCKLDLYFPVGVKDFTTVVWFHGGGITSGNKFIPEKLKEKGIAVIAVNYRLHPKASCPEYIEDAAAAVAWVFKNIGQFGGNPDKIVVSGHSAGGYLASMVGLDKKWLAEYRIDADDIAMLIPFSGHTITHMTIRKERGIPDTKPVVDEFAPLYHVRPNAPPLILITGDREREMLGRYEENAYMMRMMKVAGHQKTKLYELDSFDHGGMASPAFEILLDEIKILK